MRRIKFFLVLIFTVLICASAQSTMIDITDRSFPHFADFPNESPNQPNVYSHISDNPAAAYGDFGLHNHTPGPWIWGIILEAPRVVTVLKLQTHGSHIGNFILQGSNNTTDGFNGIWQNLLSTEAGSAGELQWREYGFENTTAYSAYRINDDADHPGWAMYRWELLAGDQLTSYAGPDQVMSENSIVVLNGSGSFVPIGPIAYKWTQVSGPAVVLSDSTIANPTFNAPAVDADTNLIFQLVVTDVGSGQVSQPNSVVITIVDPPIANAGEDVVVPENTLLLLDGSNSFDSNGEITNYKWTRKPDDIILCNGLVPTCETVSLGRAGEAIELEVTDNQGARNVDTMSIYHKKPFICGNGTVEGNEVCDSNSQSCIENNGYVGTKACNQQCSGFGSCLSSQYCGDGQVNGNEVCDGNAQNCVVGGYSGSQTCNVQCSGFNVCSSNESCGDGIKNGSETCDDGAQNGQPNKCNSLCSATTTSVCGNAVLEASEQCDDGNTNSGDGCSAACASESSEIKIWIEAENANSLVSPMQKSNDATASSGQFISVPNGNGSFFSPNATAATFTVNITKADNYILWGRVIAPGNLDDSFFVQMDSGSSSYWAVEQGSIWHWDKVNNSSGPDPVVYNLSVGSHTIKVMKRDDGTKLDKLLLTNNLSYTPSGLGD